MIALIFEPSYSNTGPIKEHKEDWSIEHNTAHCHPHKGMDLLINPWTEHSHVTLCNCKFV